MRGHNRHQRGKVALSMLLLVTDHPWRRNCVVVDVSGSDHEESILELTSTGNMQATGSDYDECIVKLTSTGNMQATGSDEEEQGVGEGGASSPVGWCMSTGLLYLAGDRTSTSSGLGGRRVWTRWRRTGSAQDLN